MNGVLLGAMVGGRGVVVWAACAVVCIRTSRPNTNNNTPDDKKTGRERNIFLFLPKEIRVRLTNLRRG
jgi:hypothetical protein